MARHQAPASAPTRPVQAAMDRVLTVHGAYIPVELLLTLGRLRYTDYEAWRCGEHAHLQTVLAGTSRRVVALLEEAADWAAQLDLQPEHQSYLGWGAHARQRLVFFEAEWREAEVLLATHYVRSKETAQFDLFFDSGPTVALQDLCAAIRARDVEHAESALATLIESAPGHRLRPAAERLTDALAYLTVPLAPDRVGIELNALEDGLLPAARELLGAHARDLLAPFWQRLAAALVDRPFDPAQPNLHASYAYARCLDWPRAISAIEAIEDHAAQPALLARLADARRRDDDRHGAIAAWCLLCWRYPAIARTHLDDPELPDPAVRAAWVQFLDQDIEVAPDVALFPAWLLLAEPGLARVLSADLADGDSPGEVAFRAVHALLHHDSTAVRKAVRDAAPWLLDTYLRSRAPA